MLSTQPPTRPLRIDTLDGARGFAMLVVFLSHFTDAFYRPSLNTRHRLLLLVTRLASPGFICISGVMLGVLHHRNRQRLQRLCDRLIDRGLFLILVGHPVLTGAMLWKSSSYWNSVRVLFITDTIGVCLIVGAWLVTRFGAAARALIGAMLLLSASILLVTWNPPVSGVGAGVKELFIGEWRDGWLTYNFPPVPWLGIYLLGSAFGSVFARLYDEGDRGVLASMTLTAGSATGFMALLLNIGLGRWAQWVQSPALKEQLVSLGLITQKLPPAPAYLLFYGGATLILLSLFLRIEATGVGGALLRWLSLFGRTSFACFAAQFYVYYVGVLLLPHPPAMLVPGYFVATVVLLRLFALAWDRMGANRFITVDYVKLAHRWRAVAKGNARTTPRAAG